LNRLSADRWAVKRLFWFSYFIIGYIHKTLYPWSIYPLPTRISNNIKLFQKKQSENGIAPIDWCCPIRELGDFGEILNFNRRLCSPSLLGCYRLCVLVHSFLNTDTYSILSHRPFASGFALSFRLRSSSYDGTRRPDKSLIQDTEYTEVFFLFLFADPPEANREGEKE